MLLTWLVVIGKFDLIHFRTAGPHSGTTKNTRRRFNMGAVAHAAGVPADRPKGWRNIDMKWIVIGVSVLLVAYLALMPLGFLLWQSFFTPATASAPATFTFGNYV